MRGSRPKNRNREKGETISFLPEKSMSTPMQKKISPYNRRNLRRSRPRLRKKEEQVPYPVPHLNDK
jgi:hypothetical protein